MNGKVETSSCEHLYDLVWERAQRFPTAIAFGAEQGLRWKTLDSRELLELVDALARELATRHGIRSGDRVVLRLPNHWRTPVYLFALWKLGAIVVPFDREMNPAAAASILESVEPRCVLVGYGERPTWAPELPMVEWWEPQPSPAHDRAVWRRPQEEVAAIFFTSGTDRFTQRLHDHA